MPLDGDGDMYESIPDAIGSDLGAELRRQLQDLVPGRKVAAYFPSFATSYATGNRPGQDAQGCGPGMFFNALVAHRAVEEGFELPMTGMLFADGNWQNYMTRLDKDSCKDMGKEAAKVLVVLLTAALYQSIPCLNEIAAARDNKMKVIVLRCEDVRTSATDMWPMPEHLQNSGDDEAMQEFVLKRQAVRIHMAAQNSTPPPGETIVSRPSELNTLFHLLRVHGVRNRQ
jgi:hypothetical protein